MGKYCDKCGEKENVERVGIQMPHAYECATDLCKLCRDKLSKWLSIERTGRSLVTHIKRKPRTKRRLIG
jgi:hypothetical protein